IHGTDIRIPKLSNSSYVITSRTCNETNTFATENTQVNNFTINETKHDVQYGFQVTLRNTEKSVNGADIIISYKSDNNENTIIETYTTNKQVFSTKKKEEKKSLVNVSVQVKYMEKTAQFGNFHLYHYQNNKQETKTT